MKKPDKPKTEGPNHHRSESPPYRGRERREVKDKALNKPKLPKEK